MSTFSRSARPAGSFQLGRVAGIDVYVHWTWLLLAYFQIIQRPRVGPFAYDRAVWSAVEFLALFGIVLLHEFGHALACRSVGGRADRVVLWLLGGAALVNPPPRPGALLWSIAAGPLVNVALLPILFASAIAATRFVGVDEDPVRFLKILAFLNGVLLVLNLLPIYPLDGGQILHALLWFVIGRVKSLIVASGIGLVAGVGLVAVAILASDYWLLLLAGFIALQCLAGFAQARRLSRLLSGPRHEDAHCPACGEAPFRGPIWVCEHCRTRFDAFEHQAVCPGCENPFPMTMCPSCHRRYPIAQWFPTVTISAADAQSSSPGVNNGGM
jgi:Zn-dependent protease